MKSARAVKTKSLGSKKTTTKAKKAPKKAAPSLVKKVTAKIKSVLKAEKKKKKPEKPVLTKEKLKLQAADEAQKKALANPFDAFLNIWKPKIESFDIGLDRFVQHFAAGEKNKEVIKAQVADKIQTQMRRHPLSPDIEAQLMERLQRDRVHKIGTIFSMKPKLTLRLNTMKADLAGFGTSQIAESLKIKRGTLTPWSFEVGKPEDLIAHPAYQRGLFEIQDESSQLASLLVNARAGQRILVMNAGQGETALALSSMMRNKGSLFVYDADPKKMKTFKDRADKAGFDNYRILTDAQISEVKSLDSVLIEAPSSSLGVIGKHPEIKWRFHKEELPKLHKIQAALLRESGRKLKLGGYMIYAAYTLNKSETEEQIDHFLRMSHNSFRLVPALAYVKESVHPYCQNFFGFSWDDKTLASFGEFDPFFTVLPDVHASPGLFLAVIQRTRIST